MRVGLQIYHFGWDGGFANISNKLVEIAKTAEKANFSSLWLMDHLFQLEGAFGPPKTTHIEEPMLEAYTTISYLAAVTQQIKLGIMVTSNHFRLPGVLVKMMTTLDVLSGGRTYFGIGAGGGMVREALGLGIIDRSIPLPTPMELVDRLEETLQITKQMWNDDRSPFKGNYYHLEEPINNPRPLSQPHPPILIGMWKGGPKMLQLVAKYADACNFQIGTDLPGFPLYVQERFNTYENYLKDRILKLKAYCDKVGRSYNDIERTVLVSVKLGTNGKTVEQVIELCKKLSDLDIHHVIFNMSNVHEIWPLEVFGREVIPTISEFESASFK